MNKEGLSSSTIKKVYEIVRNSLEHAVNFELVPKNVAAKVKLPKANKKEMTVWNEDELNQFLKIAKEDLAILSFTWH